MSIKLLIEKKRRGESHTTQEIDLLVKSLLSGVAKDYQLSAWLMAVFLKGMTEEETVALVEAMWRSGKSFPRAQGDGQYWIDKHSTGGVGDKTSLLLVPLVSGVCERLLGKDAVRIPMISGRSLGHSGGTLDKLESVPGFKIDIDLETAKRFVDGSGFCMMGQTADIVPADRILYALRDATATVESLPLVVSSILSKKLAESLNGLVIDVKFGSGAFFDDVASARNLGATLIRVAKKLGLSSKAVLTRMDEPLGRMVGTSLEVEECAEFLSGNRRDPGLNEVTMKLAQVMVEMASGGKYAASQIEEELELEISTRGAYKQFVRLFEQQGGDWKAWESRRDNWKKNRLTYTFRAASDGYVERVDARRVAAILASVGGLRPHKDFVLDADVGIQVLMKRGDKVSAGDTLLEVYYRKAEQGDEVEKLSREAVQISAQPTVRLPWVAEVLS